MNNPFLILNGEILPESKAAISPLNRGMMYGDGCFETFKSYKGKFLGLDEHVNRLSGGLAYLNIEQSFSAKQLKEHIFQLLNKNKLLNTEAMIRLQCWRDGDRGYKTSSNKMNWMMQASEIKTENQPIKLCVAETRCIPSSALDRRFKLSNGLNFIKSAQEASSQNMDDALMLTVDDYISETTSANIFWCRDDKIFTPSEDCDILPGVTRAHIISTINSSGLDLVVGKLSIGHLENAETAFCCNSIREIQKVESLNGNSFDVDHSLLNNIISLFETHKKSNLK